MEDLTVDYDEPKDDLARRDSKRRRLLSHRLAEDPSNPDLQWQHSQYAPNFFNVTSSRPNRMQQNDGIVPLSSDSWLAQTQGQHNILPYSQGIQDANQSFFYPQSQASHYDDASVWPSSSATIQTPYEMNSAYSSLITPAQAPQAVKYGNDTQYLDPHGGSDAMYDTSSLSMLSPPYSTPIQPYMRDIPSERTANRGVDTQLLPRLEHLSTRIIEATAKHAQAELQELLQRNDTASREFLATLSHFQQVYRAIGGEQDFITLSSFSPAQQDIVRKANTAIFNLSVLGIHHLSFFLLNRAFLDVFVPLGHRLLKWQGAIYLELKTQTYIMALLNNNDTPERLLDDLFPHDLDSHILQRHPDTPSLSPSEQDFVDRCRARRQYLLAESYTAELRAELPRKYQWPDFVREFSNCMSRNIEHILSSAHRQTALHSAMNRRRAGSGPVLRAASNATTADVKRSVSNGTPDKKNASGQTVRQAWTTAEEAALVAGLEHVGGPHWSQILALYGRGGSISEVLKDRNQVQLKDKARNLKLWYLKTGQEVPLSLRGVTGELRKRGGARARAALEAEEQIAKERRSSDENDGIEAMHSLRHDTVEPGSYHEYAET